MLGNEFVVLIKLHNLKNQKNNICRNSICRYGYIIHGQEKPFENIKKKFNQRPKRIFKDSLLIKLLFRI